MARQYLVGDDKKPMTGEYVIKLTIALFESETHSCGQCARPKTLVKAIWFLKNILRVKVQSKLDTETEWRVI